MMTYSAEEIVETIFEYITKIQPLRNYEEILIENIDVIMIIRDKYKDTL